MVGAGPAGLTVAELLAEIGHCVTVFEQWPHGGGALRYGTPRLLVLSGIGWAMRDDSELAAGLFQQAISLLRRLRPPKQKLDSADWHLLDTVVDDKDIKTPLKSYFAVIETLWG